MFQTGEASAEYNGNEGFIANMAMTPEALDQELRRLAREERRLDHDRANLLTHAVRLRIWIHCGRGSLSEYLEEVFGYTPKVAAEHVRVAFAIEQVPELGDMLESGEQSYTAVRELSRVATPQTIADWREAARGRCVREVEEMVSSRKKGDRPSDPKDPDLALRKRMLELRPGAEAELLRARQALSAELGGLIDDSVLIETLCAAYFAAGSSDADHGRAQHQIMTTVCDGCSQGWQDAAGRVIAVDAADVERAQCDAQRIGSDREPGRATQDITPKVRRHVWRRDHGKCRVPSCRASHNIDIHHVIHREHGGTHEADNLLLLCGGHHRALHEGKLEIRGNGANVTFNYVDQPIVSLPPRSMVAPHVGPSSERRGAMPHPISTARANYANVVVVTQAKQALKHLGYKKLDAARFVEQAFTSGETQDIETLIRAALACARMEIR